MQNKLLAICSWVKAAAENAGEVPTQGSGNYASDDEKENAQLRKELRDTKDALEILKKPSAFWEDDVTASPSKFCLALARTMRLTTLISDWMEH